MSPAIQSANPLHPQNSYCSSIDGYQLVTKPGTAEGFGESTHGFEGGANPTATLEAPQGQEVPVIVTQTSPNYNFTTHGPVEHRGRRAAASVTRYLLEQEDGNIIFRKFLPGAPVVRHKTLFDSLHAQGLTPQPTVQSFSSATERTTSEVPQHRDTQQSLDEIRYLPSCG